MVQSEIGDFRLRPSGYAATSHVTQDTCWPGAWKANSYWLIRNWRKDWGRPELPFLWVQLANYEPLPYDDATPDWPALREAKSLALALPHTAQAVAIDVGDPHDIHPRDKQTVGHRLALAARNTVYGEDVAYFGPVCTAAAREGSAVRLSFAHVDGGLVARGGELTWFELGDVDGAFMPAEARIEGDTVLVTAPALRVPAAVRYAWADNPSGCNLYNAAAPPASPFRMEVPGETAE
jgi:sialate O-acetylesterase